MPRKRNHRETQPTRLRIAGRRWNWRRVASGGAEFCRNLALLALSAPFLEPLLNNAAVHPARAEVGAFVGFVFLVSALISDDERSD